MKKSALVATSVAATVALAYPGASWLLGRQIESAFDDSYKLLAGYPDVKVVQRDYQRGVFGATEVVTFELFGDTARAVARARQNQPEAAGLPSPPQAVRFSVRSEIHHGPLPGGTSLGAAVVDSALVVEGEALGRLQKAMGDRNPVTARTVFGFTGGGTTVLSSPAFTTSFPGREPDTTQTLAWGGVEMRVDFASGLRRYTMQGSAPKLEFKDSRGGQVTVADLRLEADQQRVFDDEPLLYGGRMKFTLGEMRAAGDQPDSKPLLLKQLAYEVDVPVKGEFIDLAAKIGAETVLVGTQSYGPARYDFSLNHLHARTAAKLYRAWMKLSSDPAFFTPQAGGTGALFAPLAEPALELLKHDPEVRIDRISFRSDDGEAVLTARARFKDAKPEELANPLLALAKLDAAAELTLPERLVGQVLGGSAEADAGAAAERAALIAQRISGFEAQGLLRREGGVLKAKVEFTQGRLTVNGQPFNPLAMGNPGSAGAPAAAPAMAH